MRRWYSGRGRAYPWRGVRDPYRVLVSEVMLQQTQAGRVVPGYRGFVRRFPTIRALAQAERADVVRAWGSLGYHRRVVALHRIARMVVRHRGGRLPSDPDELMALPGIGPYTSAAVASIAFGVPVAAVDTNVARVVGRAILGRDGASPADVRTAAGRWLDRTDPGGWNQAVMDLGREICRPIPRCDACPLAGSCAFREGMMRPAPARRKQPPFAGSVRQLRGSIVRELRLGGDATIAVLAATTGRSVDDVAAAVRGLAADGVVQAGPDAMAGRPQGRVGL
jgi:A/G-specific adenine glycosylase